MSSWFWPFGGWYVDVQRNSFLSWRIWELQLQAAERELPHLSQKVLLGEIKSNSVMMSERKSTLSHQWAMSERVSWPNWHLSAGGALPKTRLRKVLCRTLFNHYLVSVSLTMVWTWLLQVYSIAIILHGNHLLRDDQQEALHLSKACRAIRGHEETSSQAASSKHTCRKRHRGWIPDLGVFLHFWDWSLKQLSMSCQVPGSSLKEAQYVNDGGLVSLISRPHPEWECLPFGGHSDRLLLRSIATFAGLRQDVSHILWRMPNVKLSRDKRRFGNCTSRYFQIMTLYLSSQQSGQHTLAWKRRAYFSAAVDVVKCQAPVWRKLST